MKHLLFEVANKEIQYVIVNDEKVYLLNEKEYVSLKDSDQYELLNELDYIAKENISKLTTSKSKRVVRVFDFKNSQLLELNFLSIPLRKKFIKAFPNFEKEFDDSKKRIRPILALIMMLFTYSFIWAGTRPSPDDINPEGIRWNLAYLNVKFLEWLNSYIGQQLILVIGFILLILLLYLIFRPELWNLLKPKLSYINPINKETTNNSN